MSIVSVEKDVDALSFVLVAEFDAPIGRVWELWADPRKLERWWGPPGYPATVTEHDLTPGGTVAYSMTGPEGDRHRGWWRVRAVDPPTSLDFTDGFANEDGTPSSELPTHAVQVRLSERRPGREWSCASCSSPASKWSRWRAWARSKGSHSPSVRWTTSSRRPEGYGALMEPSSRNGWPPVATGNVRNTALKGKPVAVRCEQSRPGW